MKTRTHVRAGAKPPPTDPPSPDATRRAPTDPPEPD